MKDNYITNSDMKYNKINRFADQEREAAFSDAYNLAVRKENQEREYRIALINQAMQREEQERQRRADAFSRAMSLAKIQPQLKNPAGDFPFMKSPDPIILSHGYNVKKLLLKTN